MINAQSHLKNPHNTDTSQTCKLGICMCNWRQDFWEKYCKISYIFWIEYTFCSMSYQQHFPHKYLKQFFCITSLVIFCLDRLISIFNQIHTYCRTFPEQKSAPKQNPDIFLHEHERRNIMEAKCPKILNQLSLN